MSKRKQAASRRTRASNSAKAAGNTDRRSAPRWLRWSAVLVFLAGTTYAAMTHWASRTAANIPDRDWTGVEPQIVTAIAAARRDVADQPRSAAAWGRLGMLFQAHAFDDDARHCYGRAAQIEPHDYRWWYLAALCAQGDDYRQSLQLFAAAAQRKPQNPAFFVNYGKALLQDGKMEDARAQFEQALRLDDDCAHALAGLGQIALWQGDERLAVEHLEHAARLDPRNRETFTQLATLYHRTKDATRARQAALRAQALSSATRFPDAVFDEVEKQAVSARAYSTRGRQMAQQGRYREAVAEFREVLEIRSDSARDHSNLGAALAGMGRTAEAIAEFRKALELHPQESFAHCNLGLIYAGEGRFDEALEHLNEARRLDPAYAEAYYNLGIVRARQGLPEQAIGHFQDALELNPALAIAHNNIGLELKKLRRYAEAVEHWERAVDIEPRNLEAWYNLGTTLASLGEFQKAIAALEQGVRQRPQHQVMAGALAWILATCPSADLRNGREAVRLARRICEIQSFNEPSALDVLAAGLAETGDFEQAVLMARRALTLARQRGDQALSSRINQRLQLYEQRRPYHQTAGSR